MRIGILKEHHQGEKRVSATPDTIKRFVGLKLDVIVEREAGRQAGIEDEAMEQAGAHLGGAPDVWQADIVLKVQPPTQEERASLRHGQVLVGALDPHNQKDAIDAYARAGVTSFALELLPRSSRAQAMDILSSQANLAGYKAVIDAMAGYSRVLPMMMTAAGTVTPAKLFVIGAGVAGLQAIATARRMGAVVSATDVRPAAREEVESLGAKFVGFVPEDAATAGGYARALTADEQAQQAAMVAEHLKNQDLVVATAQIPGRKAPRIVTEAMVRSMRRGSVLFDLAAESGGNIEGSVAGQTVENAGRSIIGAHNLPAKLAPAASILFARNLFNFVTLLVDPEEGALRIDGNDDLIAGTMLTQDGQIVHPIFRAAEAA